MFGRIFNKHTVLLSVRALKSPTILNNIYRNVTSCKRHCTLAPSKFQLLRWRLYSTQANLEAMVVDFADMKNAISNENVLIVDVREPDEVKEHGKIPSSINIPLGTVSTALSTMSDTEFETTYRKPKPTEDTEIIFYCMIGKRSGMAQQNAFNLGYKNVKNYLGSWTDWASKTQ